MSGDAKNVLIVACHPDDEVLGCGIAIQKHVQQQDNVWVLVLTNGGDSRYEEKTIQANKEACWNACNFLQCKKVIFCEFQDQMLDQTPLIDITKRIEAEIKARNISLVYTHHAGDLNKDHRIAYEATITACRPIQGQRVRRVLSYWVPSSSEWMKYRTEDNFIGNWIVKANADEVQTKIRAMKMYRNELRDYPHPRSPGAILNYSEHWGIRFGVPYAEPFQLIYTQE